MLLSASRALCVVSLLAAGIAQARQESPIQVEGQPLPEMQGVTRSPQPLGMNVPLVDRLRVTTAGRILEDTSGMHGMLSPGGYTRRENCPASIAHSVDAFGGGTFTAQGGFAEQEIAAASYTLPGSLFPIKIDLMEFIVAQQSAVVQTTTQWSVIVYDGFPTDPQPEGFPIIYSSDGTILPHIVMAPGTRGTNVQVSVDEGDPDQIYIYNPNNLANKSFTVGLRIDQHNDQTANPCFTAPSSTRNAFPATDNTIIGCNTGYSQLQQPSQNWLYAVNCGANGCPPNGGWTRFSTLQVDQDFMGFCIPGCRPRGDWLIRVTYDPVNCPPPEGACCFGTAGCVQLTQAACAATGTGVWRGPGTPCGTFSNNSWSGCVAPPNEPPVAVAGNDQTVNDSDSNGSEIVVLNGDASTDSDGFIANYRWMEGATLLQDGPAFLSAAFTVGTHTVTLTVTDNNGATATDTVVVQVEPGGCVVTCDYNQDGGGDTSDVIDLADAIASGSEPFPASCKDFNQDGGADTSDVIDMADAVASGTCP